MRRHVVCACVRVGGCGGAGGGRGAVAMGPPVQPSQLGCPALPCLLHYLVLDRSGLCTHASDRPLAGVPRRPTLRWLHGYTASAQQAMRAQHMPGLACPPPPQTPPQTPTPPGVGLVREPVPQQVYGICPVALPQLRRVLAPVVAAHPKAGRSGGREGGCGRLRRPA